MADLNRSHIILNLFLSVLVLLKDFWNNVIEIIPYSLEQIQRLYTANLMWHAISVSQTIASPQVSVFNEQPFECQWACVERPWRQGMVGLGMSESRRAQEDVSLECERQMFRVGFILSNFAQFSGFTQVSSTCQTLTVRYLFFATLSEMEHSI